MSNTSPRRNGPDPKVIGGVVAGVFVLVVASIAFIASGGDDDSDSVDPDAPIEYGIITTDGDPLPQLPEAGGDPAVGMLAPSIVSERSEEQIRLEPGPGGEPTMVVFLAHWCPHCQAEVPRLAELEEAGAFDDIRVVNVLTATTPERDNYPPSAWLDREGLGGDRLFDDEQGTVAANYGLSGLPFLVFLDGDGNVVQRISGEQPPEVIEAAVATITP